MALPLMTSINKRGVEMSHRMWTVRRRKIVVPLAAAASALLILSACSSGNDNKSSGSSGNSSGEGASTAQSRLDAVSGEPEFKAPADAKSFDANKAKGKTVYYVNTDDSLPVSVIWRDIVVNALKPYGVNVVPFNGKGSSAEYNKGMQQAISQHADAIFNLAVSPPLVQQSIKDAKNANIPVISATDGMPEASQNSTFVDGITAEVSYDYEKVGRLEADWFVADSKANGHVFYIRNSDQPSEQYVSKGFRDEVKQLCPDCKITDRDVPASQATTQLPTLVQNAIRADSSITHVVADFDFQVPVIENGLRLANASNKVKIGSWNAIPTVMTSMKTANSPVYADFGAPNSWFGYAIADTILRTLSGEKPAVWGTDASNFMGVRLFSKDSVKNLDVTKYNDQQLYGLSEDTVKSEFQKLWGAPGQ